MTEDPNTETTPDILTIAPVDSTSPSSSSSSSGSVPRGAIAGAVVGGTIFALLVVLGFFLLIRRRRKRREEHISNKNLAEKAEGLSTEEAGYGNTLSPPFAVDELAIPSHPPTSPRGKRASVSSMIRRQSLAPNWPFPIGVPMSPRHPLSSHPVFPLEKRLSLDEISLRPQSTSSTEIDVPIRGIQSPPVLRTRLAPPPPLAESKSLGTSDGASSAAPGGSVLHSPRLSCIPPPAVDTASGEDVKRTPSFEEPGDHAGISIDRSQDEVDYIVSPISPDDAEGRASPMTVSPLESQRGSFGMCPKAC